MSYQSGGFVTPTQTTGDCKQIQCDGSGGTTNVNLDSDTPADDGNQCTSETCNSGVPAHPLKATSTACSQNGGSYCSSEGACVECLTAATCAGTDTECQTRTCSVAGSCGMSYQADNFITQAQTVGDCQQVQCNGAGGTKSITLDTDIPSDNRQCTSDTCSIGVPSNTNSTLGTACTESGGTVCDGQGNCVAAPAVSSTTPSDGASVLASTSVTVAFTQAMNPTTLTGQTTAGACSGSIQVSLDNFASCIAFSSASAAMTASNTTATLTPAPGLLVNRTYKVRVTTTAANASGIPLQAQFTQPTGFSTTSPNVCNGSLVISQIYTSGGLTSALYKNDFVELHNRGTTSINLTGLSLQYTSTAGTAWSSSKVNLVGSVAAGAYFLVQYGSGGTVGSSLPTPDQTSGIDIGANGKLALVSSISGLAATSCPDPALTLDFVGMGTANCSEGTTLLGLTAALGGTRNGAGCVDRNANRSDFALAAPAPRNSAAANVQCTCVSENESGTGSEVDWCNVQSPTSLSATTGTTTATVFSRIYEASVTTIAGADASISAQLGYGPLSANPQYDPAWKWFNASYNGGFVDPNNDEYQGTFVAPATGTYGYAYRFTLDGQSWTTCDTDGTGANAGLTFDIANIPVLTVTP